MGYVFEDLVRRFNEKANEEAGDHFTPREVIKLMVTLLFTYDDLVYEEGKVIKILIPRRARAECSRSRKNSLRILKPVSIPVPTSNSSARNTIPRPMPSVALIS